VEEHFSEGRAAVVREDTRSSPAGLTDTAMATATLALSSQSEKWPASRVSGTLTSGSAVLSAVPVFGLRMAVWEEKCCGCLATLVCSV
jgi:hypothetical protein